MRRVAAAAAEPKAMAFIEALDAPWIWLALGAALIALEVSTGTLFILWPAVAAVALAALTALFPDLSIAAQIFAFASVAILLGVIGHGYFKMRPGQRPSDRPHLNATRDQMIGRRVLAAEDFVNGYGPVTVGDTRWRARLEDPAASVGAGATLLIIDLVGAELVVRPA